MPRLDFRNRPIEEVRALLNSRRGLLPLELHCDNREITWFDFGDMHLRETFLEISAEERLSQHADAMTVVTDLEVLEAPDLFDDAPCTSRDSSSTSGDAVRPCLPRCCRAWTGTSSSRKRNLYSNCWVLNTRQVFREKRASYFQSLINIYGHRRLPVTGTLSSSSSPAIMSSGWIWSEDCIRVFPGCSSIAILTRSSRPFSKDPPGSSATRILPKALSMPRFR